MNKNILVGVGLVLGGFVLGGVAGPELLAVASSSQDSSNMTVRVCQDAFRQAELKYKAAVNAAKEARDMAREVRNRCVKDAKQKEKDRKPTRTPSASPTVQKLR